MIARPAALALGFFNEELIKPIRAVHKGQSIHHSSLSRTFSNEFACLARAKNAYRSHLAQRELEIVHLINGAKTNDEIGAQLSLSETRVKREVSHILDKLAATDQAEALT